MICSNSNTIAVKKTTKALHQALMPDPGLSSLDDEDGAKHRAFWWKKIKRAT